MTFSVKQTMMEYMILNEAELFCSDLEFKISGNAEAKFTIRDGSRDSKNTRMACDERLYETI